MGFADAARAERLLLTDLGITEAELRTDALVTALAAVADPDLALIGLARIFDASDHPHALRAALRSEQDFRDRLTAVLGVSAAWPIIWPGTRKTARCCAVPSAAPLRCSCARR